MMESTNPEIKSFLNDIFTSVKADLSFRDNKIERIFKLTSNFMMTEVKKRITTKKTMKSILQMKVHGAADTEMAKTLKKKRKDMHYYSTVVVLIKRVSEILLDVTLGERYTRLHENIFQI